MTIISALKFNNTSAAMIADEQSSSPQRNIKTAEKLHSLSTEKGINVIFGGAGMSDALYEVAYLTLPKMASAENSEHIAHILQQGSAYEKDSLREEGLQSNFSLGYDDVLRGYKLSNTGEQIPLSSEVRNHVDQFMHSFQNQYQFGFATIVSDEKALDLYTVDTECGKPMLSSRPFIVIGSGSDMADAELSDFLESMTREQRTNIDPMKGLGVLLNGTYKASSRNNGVGGVPMIKMLHQGTIYTPKQNECLAATEITRGTKAGYFSEEFHNEALEALVLKGESYSSVLDQAKNEAKHSWDDFSMHLRGYK